MLHSALQRPPGVGGRIEPNPIMIRIIINGASEQFDPPLSVATLLERRQLAGKRLAVERNGEIVPKGRHGDTLLNDGDVLEIVVAVGGG